MANLLHVKNPMVIIIYIPERNPQQLRTSYHYKGQVWGIA